MRADRYIRIPGYIAFPFLIAFAFAYLLSIETVEILVEDKSAGRYPQAIQKSPRNPVYPRMASLIYSRDEIFEVDWTFIYLDFRVAERYHSMKIGQRYRVTVAGWRVPIFHWYRNILKVES